MKPETRTVTHLFELDVRYVVPLYQRPYVWNQTDQWEPLWEDVRALIDHQLEGSWGTDGWSHFLGAIVLEQETQAPGSIPMYTVIDGQQRLTTLQILLAAAAQVAASVGCATDEELLRDLVENNPLKSGGEETFKVWPTNANRKAFKAVMQQGGPPPDNVDDPNNRIEEAYDYFVRQLSEWLADTDDSSNDKSWVKMLRVTLCDLMKVVSITLEPDDNAQIIFETLNARGTPLLALDLVKNAVFHEAARQDLDVDELYAETWRPELDDDYWRAEVRQGRLFRPRAELFLMHWLGMKLRRIIPATELFAIFRQRILHAPDAPRMDELIRELVADAKTLRSFDNQPADSPEAWFFERLANLDTTTLMPLVLSLFTERDLAKDRRRRALAALESWLVRRTLMRLTTKNYNQQVAAMLDKVQADPLRADEIIIDHLRSATGEATRWPMDEELIAYLERNTAYGNVAQSRLAMVFAAIERSLYTNKVEAVAVPSGLSIEHVMPQRWRSNWPLSTKPTPEQETEATAAREQRIHRLGNLTVTTSPLNSSLSNAAWPSKRKELNSHSKLLVNQELIDNYPADFDETSIDERTRLLAGRICAIWPGAEAAWSDADDIRSTNVAPPNPPALDEPVAGVRDGAETDEGELLQVPGELGVASSIDDPGGSEKSRAQIRRLLEAGLTPDQIFKAMDEKRATYVAAIEEEARLADELGSYAPTPDDVVKLRDDRQLRWERIAARVFSDALRVGDAKALYDEARGEGASRRSYTGRGRRFPDMNELS